jgi:pimeloyl-ACP methyl ester carboxylesterase
MNPLARAWFWALDYLYVAYWHLHGSFWRIDSAKYAKGSRQPILLLPGIWESWQIMRPIADLLHELGHPVHVVAGLGRNSRAVSVGARIVEAYLEEHDLSDVIIVAHSKGGLIGKFIMMDSDGPQRVDRMVAITSPFSGSSLARYTVLPSLRAFAPTDPTIRMLVAEQFVNARITSIFGSFDPHIPDGSELPGATNIRLPVAGHFRILGDRQLLAAVEAAAA